MTVAQGMPLSTTIGSGYVYVLLDLADSGLRRPMYFGLSTGVGDRFVSHIQNSSDSTKTQRVYQWIREIQKRRGLLHEIRLFEGISDHRVLQLLEIRMIQVAKALDIPILNMTDGGELGDGGILRKAPEGTRFLANIVPEVVQEVRSLLLENGKEKAKKGADYLDKFLRDNHDSLGSKVTAEIIRRALNTFEDMCYEKLVFKFPSHSPEKVCEICGGKFHGVSEVTGQKLCHKHHDAARRPPKKKNDTSAKKSN